MAGGPHRRLALRRALQSVRGQRSGWRPQYVYNALGQRVEKIVGGVAKYYLYNPAGRAVTMLDQNGNWLRGEIFAGARHIATYDNNTTYFDDSDRLGTLRMSATLAGYEQSECTSGPFGEGMSCAGSPTPLQFTGQQHDAETGLDYFPARYYTSTWARWMVPDWSPVPTAVPYANFVNPQSLDLYVYLMDNPVSGTDPTGHSHSVYDGAAHVIYLVAHGGAVVRHWTAYNNVAIRNDNTLLITAGPLPNGRYAIRPVDRHGARLHLGGSRSSAYGPGGIIHIREHTVFGGRVSVASGVGVHGGREGFPWMGYLSLTNGCVRTCNQGMLNINGWLRAHPNDPLHYLQVKNNQLDVRTWVRGAEEECEAQTGTVGCKALAQYIGKHPNVLGGDSR